MKKLIVQRNPCQSQEAGYALIESLIAIVVVAILMTAVTPMIVFSAGTRMQAKRIQLSTQAAQSYITDVSNDSEAIGNVVLIEGNEDDLLQVKDYPAPPDLGVTCRSQDNDDSHKCPVSENEGYFKNRTLYCVNFDEKPGCGADSMVDMVVQPIGLYLPIKDNAGQPTNDPNVQLGYNLSLRVYRANSFHPQVFSWYGKLQAQEVDKTVTQALGNRTLPLFQTATFIAPSDNPNKSLYNSYCERLGGCQ
jgi:prepilin-type N-terminal cleavage/methylation domain-containing protein